MNRRSFGLTLGVLPACGAAAAAIPSDSPSPSVGRIVLNPDPKVLTTTPSATPRPRQKSARELRDPNYLAWKDLNLARLEVVHDTLYDRCVWPAASDFNQGRRPPLDDAAKGSPSWQPYRRLFEKPRNHRYARPAKVSTQEDGAGVGVPGGLYAEWVRTNVIANPLPLPEMFRLDSIRIRFSSPNYSSFHHFYTGVQQLAERLELRFMIGRRVNFSALVGLMGNPPPTACGSIDYVAKFGDKPIGADDPESCLINLALPFANPVIPQDVEFSAALEAAGLCENPTDKDIGVAVLLEGLHARSLS